VYFRTIIIISIILFLTACSFDETFLYPTKIPDNSKRVTLTTHNDTILVLFNDETHQPTFLKNGHDTINYNFTVKSVIFESLNGNKLNGWLLEPKNETPKITLLHFHGNAGSLVSQYQRISPLIEYGFQVFMFDYSGFGFSEGEATRDNVLIDANSALTYLQNLPEIKNTKIIIYGQSLGGHLSAVVASQREADIDGLVIEGAFSSHKDIAAEHSGFWGRIFVSEKYSASKSIKSFHKPVLVIHSNVDHVIPFEMGQKIYDNANEPKEFYEIQECHICGAIFYPTEISDKIKKMIEVE